MRSQEGDRIYAAISISDYSGSTSGAMIQEPALILSGATDMKHFNDLVEKRLPFVFTWPHPLAPRGE